MRFKTGQYEGLSLNGGSCRSELPVLKGKARSLKGFESEALDVLQHPKDIGPARYPGMWMLSW